MVKNTYCREQSGGRRFKMEETRAWWIVLKSYLSSSDILRDIFLVEKKKEEEGRSKKRRRGTWFCSKITSMETLLCPKYEYKLRHGLLFSPKNLCILNL